jgi:hypothetical protein
VQEALAERALRVRRERERLEGEERLRQWEAQERLRREEEKKIKQWDEWMSNWKRAKDVREFASALREAREPIEPGSKVEGWLRWADEYAARIDPLGQ